MVLLLMLCQQAKYFGFYQCLVYEQGFATALTQVPDGHYSIMIFQLVYFPATKMEAFNNPGGGDGRWNSDFEDIVYVLNNRISIWEELQPADKDVKACLNGIILLTAGK
jgi:hypothetical protein